MATQIVQAPASAENAGTAPLPPAAVEAIHRLEARLAGLMDGESVVINGAMCTRISPQVADTLARLAAASRTCRQLSASSDWMAAGEFDRLADVQDAMAAARTQLERAGRLDLIEGGVASEPTRIDMSRPNGDAIRATVDGGGRLELHDSTRPDVAPIVLDDFLMAVMRGEAS